ncbi:MAG: PAS domain-containing protein [Blastocatellia bacterium]
MIDTVASKISSSSKIIVGVDRSENEEWFSLHLHDCRNAISIRLDEGVIVIAEGKGPNRLRNTTIPFKDVIRLEAVELQIGHDCVTEPVNSDYVGNYEYVSKGKPFTPVSVLLLHGDLTGEDSYVSVYDLGSSPLPILVPQLKELPEWAFGNAVASPLRSADDCLRLAAEIVKWIDEVNTRIDESKGLGDGARDVLRQEVGRLNMTELDEKQVLLNAMAALYIMISLYARVKMLKYVRIWHSFPIHSSVNKDLISSNLNVVVGELYDLSVKYTEETGRPISEAVETIKEYIDDLQERAISTSKDLAELKDSSERKIDIIDSALNLTGKLHDASEFDLLHEEQLKKIFENEGIKIVYLPGLSFLSLLVEYGTDDNERHYAAIIKAGRTQVWKEFLLAHELGHWALHISSDTPKISDQARRFIRSSGERTFFEDEADAFGVAVLFPFPYLADREILKGSLSAEDLFEEFTRGLGHVTDEFKAEMLNYIQGHIDRYIKFKEADIPSIFSIEVPYVKEEQIKELLSLMEQGDKGARWVKLDEANIIQEVNNGFTELMQKSKEEITGKTPLDFIMPEEVERMKWRTEHRMNSKKAIYYFTKLSNGRKVIVYSFPILNTKDEYIGAIAVLKPLDQMRMRASLYSEYSSVAEQ